MLQARVVTTVELKSGTGGNQNIEVSTGRRSRCRITKFIKTSASPDALIIFLAFGQIHARNLRGPAERDLPYIAWSEGNLDGN